MEGIKKYREIAKAMGCKIAQMRVIMQEEKSFGKKKKLQKQINYLSEERQQLLLFIRTGSPIDYKLPEVLEQRTEKPPAKSTTKAKTESTKKAAKVKPCPKLNPDVIKIAPEPETNKLEIKPLQEQPEPTNTFRKKIARYFNTVVESLKKYFHG